MRIVLADPGHDPVAMSSDIDVSGVASLAAYTVVRGRFSQCKDVLPSVYSVAFTEIATRYAAANDHLTGPMRSVTAAYRSLFEMGAAI